jgi:hypothetical protein
MALAAVCWVEVVSDDAVTAASWARLFNGVTIRVAVVFAPAYDAVMVAVVETDTVDDAAVNVALVLPAATATVAGTDTAEELLLNDTEAPPVGAGPVKVTVP